MRQTRLGSLIEVSINIGIGFVISMIANMLILPHYGHNVTWADSFWITFWFTVLSVVRSYFVRRLFEARLHALSQRLAEELQ